jgi:hypothetical protein
VPTGVVSTLAATVAVGSGLITGCMLAQPVMSSGRHPMMNRIRK